jgi:hypothetical protein
MTSSPPPPNPATRQLAALDAQIADRDAYLKLADDLEGFLAQLRENAETAEVSPTPARPATRRCADTLLNR